MTPSAATALHADADFERLYQQAYYRHSGFGPDEQPQAAPRRSFMPRRTFAGIGLAEVGFAAIALVFFIVPAVTAAAFMA